MGGDIKIDWRDPVAIRKPRAFAVLGDMAGMSARLVVVVGVMLAVGWMAQRQWLPALEMPWLFAALVALGMVSIPLLVPLASVFMRYHYRLDENGITNRDARSQRCKWAQAVCFDIEPWPDAPEVDMLCLYSEGARGFRTRVWEWLSGAEVEPHTSWLEVALPEDAESARRIVAEVERRVPQLVELDAERRPEIEARIERARSHAPRVVKNWLDAGGVLVAAVVAGAAVGGLYTAGFLPDFWSPPGWMLAVLSPLVVVGPATWLALFRHGRAGFATFRVRQEVLFVNIFVVFVAWVAAFMTTAVVVMSQ